MKKQRRRRLSWVGAATLAIVTGTISGVIATVITARLIKDEPPVVRVDRPRPVAAAQSSTTVRLINLFAPDGKLRLDRHLVKERGVCFPVATASPREDARRCFGDQSFVHDPCFAGIFNRGRVVVCPDTPWGGPAHIIRIRGYLKSWKAEPPGPFPEKPVPSVAALGGANAAWAVELVNGDRCVAVTGGTRPSPGALPQFYDCESGAAIGGRLDGRTPLWQANYFPRGSQSGHQVDVSVAWL